MRSARQRHWYDRSAGSTIIELLVSLTLLAIAVTGIVGVTRTATWFAVLHAGRLDAQQGLRRSIERIAEELRWAESILPDPLCSGGLCPDRLTAQIPAANPYRGDQPYVVTFQLNSRQREVERRVGSGTNNLAAGITDFAIAYFDVGGRPAATAPAVTRLRLTLVAATRAGQPVTLETDVGLRNFRLPRPVLSPSPTPSPAWRPSPRGRPAPEPVDGGPAPPPGDPYAR
jgi:hypothetical protein